MSAVKIQFESMKAELEELSPNLYKKVYTFLVEENPSSYYTWCSKTNINIGWSNLDGLKEHCDSGKNPLDLLTAKLLRQFYTDTQKFTFALNKIFNEIKKRKEYPNIEVTTLELDDRSIEIKITQIDSISSRSVDELLKRSK